MSSVAEQIFGQNKAPVEEVLVKDFAPLAQRVADAVAAIRARPAKVKDQTDFAAVGALIVKTNKFIKEINETRKDETDPLYYAQRDIKGHFDQFLDSLNAALAPHQRAADDYTREEKARQRREAEEEARKLREKADEEARKAAEKTGAAAARAEGRAEALNARADAAETKADAGAADAVRTRTATGGTATAATSYDFEITDYDAIDMNKLRHFLPRPAVETAIRSLVRVNKQHTSLPGVRVFEKTQARFR